VARSIGELEDLATHHECEDGGPTWASLLSEEIDRLDVTVRPQTCADLGFVPQPFANFFAGRAAIATVVFVAAGADRLAVEE